MQKTASNIMTGPQVSTELGTGTDTTYSTWEKDSSGWSEDPVLFLN